MKRTRIWLLVASTGLFANAQNPPFDLSWTFQCDNARYGLLFESANLTADVKTSIRDDVQNVFSCNSSAGATFHALSAGEPKYGIYTGWMSFSEGKIPNGFPLFFYKVFNGTNYFIVDAVSSDDYATKIALTNQQCIAINSLSNFLYTVQNMTTNSTTVASFKQKWWNPLKEDVYDPQEPDAAIVKYISMYGELHYFYPSILSFENVTYEGKSWFGCKVWTSKKGNLKPYLQLDLVFGGGEWRFVPLSAF
jgi:hypothetical protein